LRVDDRRGQVDVKLGRRNRPDDSGGVFQKPLEKGRRRISLRTIAPRKLNLAILLNCNHWGDRSGSLAAIPILASGLAFVLLLPVSFLPS